MEKLLNTGLTILLLLVFSGCEKEEIKVSDDFVIEFGTVCGWCAGSENITITSSKIEYLRNIPCGVDKALIKKERKISNTEWDEIISLLDYPAFKSLDNSTCNICADGCDAILKISESDDAHEIRYTPSSDIEEIKDFQKLLLQIMDEMRNQD